MSFVKAIGMGLSQVFQKTPSDNGLVRLFEVEYNKDYRNLRKHGVDIDANFVRSYLRSR